MECDIKIVFLLRSSWDDFLKGHVHLLSISNDCISQTQSTFHSTGQIVSIFVGFVDQMQFVEQLFQLAFGILFIEPTQLKRKRMD